MSLNLKISVEEAGRVLILRLDGRLDAATVPVLERKLHALSEEGRRQFLLDFLHVDYLSSAGMRLLLTTSQKLRAKKGILLLCSMGEEVMETIKLAGFEKILFIFETEQDALQSGNLPE